MPTKKYSFLPLCSRQREENPCRALRTQCAYCDYAAKCTPPGCSTTAPLYGTTTKQQHHERDITFL
eukprot:scaffold229302_cov61-Cyclotella_meneghiniana.AAC.5